MNPRQHYALTHPLNDAGGAEAARIRTALTGTRRHATGLLILSILAIDR